MNTKPTIQDRMLGQLERMAEAFPWDTVQLQIEREPGGEMTCTAYIPSNPQIGCEYAYESAPTPEEVVSRIIERHAHLRDPHVARTKAVEKMRAALAKLEAEVFGMPPYVPGRELAFPAAPLDIEGSTSHAC